MVLISEKLSGGPVLDTFNATGEHPQNRRLVASAASAATVRLLVLTLPAKKPKQQIAFRIVKPNDFIVVSKAFSLGTSMHHFVISGDCGLYDNEKQKGASYPNNCQDFVDPHD
jgi:hypothetical protein